MKKILYAALGLSIFIFGGSLSLTQAAQGTPYGDFGVKGECYWEFDDQTSTFTVSAPSGDCTLETDSKDVWEPGSNQIKIFKINSGVKAPADMSYYFYNLTKVETIDINNLDISDVTNMASAFYKFGSGVAELNLSGWNTSNVATMRGMFQDSDIKSLKLGSSFVTSGVIDFNTMFAGSKFEELELNFDTSSATDMDEMFNDANYLTKLDISKFDMTNFYDKDTQPYNVFKNIGSSTSSGTEIKINSTFKKSRGEAFDRYAFPSQYYKVNGGDMSGRWSLNSEIESLSGTITLTPVLPPANGGFFGYDCQWTFDSASGSFIVEPVDANAGCQLKDGSRVEWLNRRYNIKSFTIKSGVKAPKNMVRFFEDLTHIETMDVNNLDVSSTTDMFCAFCGLSQLSSGLNELDLSSWNTPKVENMHGMFTNTNVKYLKLGNGFDTSNVNYFQNMFTNSAFEELILNFDTSKVNFNMEYMFADATKLKKLDISSFYMNKVLPTSDNPPFPGGFEMFYNVGKDVPEGTTIKLNRTFVDKLDALNFPATGYKLECDNGGENFLYKYELQDLDICLYTGTLTPAYYVAFIYNDGKNGSAGRIFLPGDHIDTAGITLTKSGHKLEKWTDTQDGTNASVEILPGATSQSGYGAYYADDNPKALYAQWEEYKVTSGDNQTYTKGSNTDIVIKTNGEIANLGRILVNSGIIDPNNYIPQNDNGETTLILKSSYLENLPAGTYTVQITFTDGYNSYEISATLTIKNQTTGGGGGGSSGGGGKRNTTPVIMTGSEESSEQLTGDVQEPQEEKSEFELAYEFAFKHGITTMDTIEKANMTGNLTRIAMAKMLSYYAINVLGQTPDTTKVCEFDDVSTQEDVAYNNGVTLACQLGFMGVGMKNFRPYDTVIRAEFVTALSRMLFGTPDGDPYYVTHLQKLKSEGIIKNDDPNMEEVRGYTMIMLMRSKE